MGYTEESWSKKRRVSVGTFRSTPAMFDNLQEVMQSGIISYGKFSKLFERRFSELHGCQYGLLVNSGTSALQLALQAMMELHNWQPGERVIVPATTFVATANIVVHNRLVPYFVDVDPTTYNLDVTQLEAITDDRIRAIIPVHLFGQPANMQEIVRISQAKGWKIIEDSCESMFATHHHSPVGSWGDIACFSTYVAHLLVTGVGGLAITNHPDYAARMRSLANHGLDLEQLDPDENFTPRPVPNRRFRFTSYGHSYRLTELEAAIGLPQLEEQARREMLNLRHRNARHLLAGLGRINRQYGNPLQLPYIAPENTSAWMMFPLVLNRDATGANVDKEPLLEHLYEWQIETRDMLPLINQPIYKHLDQHDFPVSKWILESGFYIGCHQDLTPDEIQYTVDCFERYFEVLK